MAWILDRNVMGLIGISAVALLLDVAFGVGVSARVVAAIARMGFVTAPFMSEAHLTG